MSAIGPKQTWPSALHMSAFGGKADMALGRCLLLRSLLGVKRTWLFATHMSAFDPKWTFGSVLFGPSLMGHTFEARLGGRPGRSLMRTQILAFAVLLPIGCESWAADQQRRIYLLESLSPALPGAVRTIDAFKKRLSEKTTERFEIFIDYMELVRSEEHTSELQSLRHI